jgi:hypothetical protein
MKVMLKIKKRLGNKKLLLSALVVLLVAGGAFALNQRDTSPETSANSPNKTLKASPPTEQEKQSGDQVKSDVLADEQKHNGSSSQTTSGKRNVSPTITYAGVYGNSIEVGAFVNGIFEDGGKCTLVLQKGSSRLTTTVTAVKGSNNVSCPVMSVPRSSIQTGSWQATVSYSSSAAEGQSSPQTVEVQ